MPPHPGFLLPALVSRPDDRLRPVVDQILPNHGVPAALLVPPPTHGIVRAIRYILERHNVLEESPDGLYDVCERLPEETVAHIVTKTRQELPVRVQPHNATLGAIDAAKRAYERAVVDPEILS